MHSIAAAAAGIAGGFAGILATASAVAIVQPAAEVLSTSAAHESQEEAIYQKR